MKLNTSHLKRYKEIAGLFWKYGRSDLVKQMGVDEEEARAHRKDKHAGAEVATEPRGAVLPKTEGFCIAASPSTIRWRVHRPCAGRSGGP